MREDGTHVRGVGGAVPACQALPGCWGCVLESEARPCSGSARGRSSAGRFFSALPLRGQASRGQPLGVEPVWVEGTPYWLGGDILVSADGVRLTKEGQLGTIVWSHKPGDVISIRLWRDGRLMTVKAKLAALP